MLLNSFNEYQIVEMNVNEARVYIAHFIEMNASESEKMCNSHRPGQMRSEQTVSLHIERNEINKRIQVCFVLVFFFFLFVCLSSSISKTQVEKKKFDLHFISKNFMNQ